MLSVLAHAVWLDRVVGTALLVQRVVDDQWSLRRSATFRLIQALPLFAVILGCPSLRRPEEMVLFIEDFVFAGHFSGKVKVTLAEVTLTSAGFIGALGLTSALCPIVLDKFPDTIFPELSLDTFLTVLVLLANLIEGVDGPSKSRVTHWPVAKDETVAAIGPVLAFVKLRCKMLHQFQ